MSTFQDWQLDKIYHRGEVAPSPRVVFGVGHEDGRTRPREDWEKLFIFASYCKSWNEEKREECYYPLADEGWDYLKKMLYYMYSERFLVILKVRQILATWTLAVLFLWECMRQDNATCGFASKGVAEGKEFLTNRCAHLYHRLPQSWRDYSPVKTVRGMYNTYNLMQFHNGSRIKCYSSSGEGPRSDVLTRAAIDEANYIRECSAMMASFRPALGKDRPLVVLSTPRTVESDFEQIVEDAEAGNGGELLKFPVTCRPGRDTEWQREMEAQLGEDKYATEYGLSFALRDSHALFPGFNVHTHVVEEEYFDDMLQDSGYSLTIEKAHGRDHACPIYCGMDTHVRKPNAALWMAVLPNEDWYIFDEMWERVDVYQMARMMLRREEDYRVIDRVIDPSANAPDKTRNMQPVSVLLRQAGLTGLRTADRHKIGINHLQAKMEPGKGGRPGLYVHPRCKRTIRQLRTAGLTSEQQAMKGGKYDFLDCAKYIANCRPSFHTYRYQEEQKEQRGAYVQLLRDLDDNMAAAMRGYAGGKYKCRRTLH